MKLESGNPEPGFEGGGLGAAAGGDEGGGGWLVDHAGGEFDQCGGLAAGALAGEVEGEVEGAGDVDGVFLRVARFAAAVEDVGVFGSSDGGEDFGQGFCTRGKEGLASVWLRSRGSVDRGGVYVLGWHLLA